MTKPTIRLLAALVICISAMLGWNWLAMVALVVFVWAPFGRKG